MIVLCYHRISALRPDPFGLCVSPDHFCSQLTALSDRGRLVSLKEMAERLARGDDSLCFALTFDDGYCDFFTHAVPLAEKFSAPLAVFIPSAYPDSGREFWWEELARSVLTARPLPPVLKLELSGDPFVRSVPDAGEDPKAVNSWRWGSPSAPLRAVLYRDLYGLLRPLPYDQRGRLLKDLLEWSGENTQARPQFRAMGWDEIRLVQNRGVTIGGHTRTHPQLSALDTIGQYSEIVHGKREIETALRASIDFLAYPHGSPMDVTRESMDIACRAGYKAAFSVRPGKLTGGGDSFMLPRFCVCDVDGPTLMKQLEAYLKE